MERERSLLLRKKDGENRRNIRNDKILSNLLMSKFSSTRFFYSPFQIKNTNSLKTLEASYVKQYY